MSSRSSAFAKRSSHQSTKHTMEGNASTAKCPRSSPHVPSSNTSSLRYQKSQDHKGAIALRPRAQSHREELLHRLLQERSGDKVVVDSNRATSQPVTKDMPVSSSVNNPSRVNTIITKNERYYSACPIRYKSVEDSPERCKNGRHSHDVIQTPDSDVSTIDKNQEHDSISSPSNPSTAVSISSPDPVDHWVDDTVTSKVREKLLSDLRKLLENEVREYRRRFTSLKFFERELDTRERQLDAREKRLDTALLELTTIIHKHEKTVRQLKGARHLSSRSPSQGNQSKTIRTNARYTPQE